MHLECVCVCVCVCVCAFRIVFRDKILRFKIISHNKTTSWLTPCSVMVMVEGAMATLTKVHFSAGTL